VGCSLSLVAAPADQIEMQNGDRYVGKVLSVTTNTVTFQSEVLGTVNLPRGRVANITLATGAAATNSVPAALTGQQRGALQRQSIQQGSAPALTNGNLSSAFRELGSNTNFIKDIQSQFLSGAGPEANAKFNDMLADLMSGKLNVSDIRSQAQVAANQLRAAKKDLGGDETGVLDEYLAILDKFVQETAPAVPSVKTNPPVLKPKPAATDESKEK
jgi:hypothetical protein